MSDFSDIFGANGFDPASVPAQNYDPIPAGWYKALVVQADVVPTKAGDGQRIKIEFEIVDGEHQGRKLFGNINIVNPNPKAQEIGLRELAELTRACGLVTVRDTSEFIDKVVLIKVSVRADAGREPDNDIKGYKAIGGAAPASTPRPAPVAPAVNPDPAPKAATTKKGAFPWEKK